MTFVTMPVAGSSTPFEMPPVASAKNSNSSPPASSAPMCGSMPIVGTPAIARTDAAANARG
ncbi:MAG TPA: hypothetical protein VFZ65_23745 [Planctomycetota bacterium]|nr:hypothetical protein [Planctomycetota bacterium]